MNAQTQISGEPLYRQIGAFLAEHGLWPTPENYALIYAHVTAEDSPVSAAIQAATGDGLRLTQRDVDKIAAAHGGSAPQGPADAEALASARRQMDDFAAMVESSRAEAQSYGRDLEAGVAQLEEDGAAGALAAITKAMIERTKAAERQLTAARDEAQVLRVKLAEAGEEARRDTLTKLPNRRAFEEKLEDLAREGVPVSIAICDIDRFKRVNDTYGHGVGDRVLRLVADILDQHCGQHMVARLGGEEFVVLFERLAPAEAARHLDAARLYLAAKQFKVRETDAPLGKISFSAGIATGADALSRADALLYEAKNGGRNQVRCEA
ncbi:GGDEF domain-containing protein [Sphingosinicella sp.]|uniref:GGDEF domain-containing protein n=1 Tax=Sphingosinicella sp. TaxID=1917971 RepID=UPI00403837CA